MDQEFNEQSLSNNNLYNQTKEIVDKVNDVLEENKELGKDILHELKTQGKVIKKTQDNVENINENISKSKKIINKLSRVCIIC